MTDSGDKIMVTPHRTINRRVTSFKRRNLLPPPPFRSRPKGIHINPNPGPVMSENDFPRAFLRELVADDHSDDEEKDHFVDEVEDEEEENDDRILEDKATKPPPQKVSRDGKDRYLSYVKGSSSSSGRKKTKKDLSFRLTHPVEGRLTSASYVVLVAT